MANTDWPRGFWPTRSQSGGTYAPPKEYTVAASTTIAQGAVVKRNGSGYVTNASAGDAKLLGIAAHLATAAASSTSTKIMVYDDPNTVFGCQTVTGTSYNINMEGATADFVATSVGSSTYNTNTGVSYNELNIGTLNGSALNFLIIGHIDRVDNDKTLAHCDVEVIINEHQNKGTAQAGV